MCLPSFIESILDDGDYWSIKVKPHSPCLKSILHYIGTSAWRHDIRHNDTKYNDTRHDAIQCGYAECCNFMQGLCCSALYGAMTLRITTLSMYNTERMSTLISVSLLLSY